MKLSESQIRQVIREELEDVLNEMHGQKEQDPKRGFSVKELLGMAAVGVGGNLGFAALQQFFKDHPHILEVAKAYFKSKGMMENKSNK